MEQCSSGSCVFRMVVDGKVSWPFMYVDDIVDRRIGRVCRDSQAALVTKSPTNNLGVLTWYTGCAFQRDWELEALEITQKAIVKNNVKSFGVDSSSDISATPGVEL